MDEYRVVLTNLEIAIVEYKEYAYVNQFYKLLSHIFFLSLK